MQILQVDLSNVKSYAQLSVDFSPGTNAICGHNGAGKSTILEAIGFALFDTLEVNQADFVREGEKTATVAVHIVAADGRPYRVVRKCGASSQYYVYDPELGKLTEGKSETTLWLREFLGVDENTDLSALFRDAVGVPQGRLTAAFLETPARRKDVFNPLLQVDEYERVWSGLREPRRQLERRATDVEKRIAGFEGQIEALPGLQEKLAGLGVAIERDASQQQHAQLELSELSERKLALEETKAALDGCVQELRATESQAETLGARLDEARVVLKRAELAQSIVAETSAAHAAYMAAQAELADLEDVRMKRDSLRQKQQSVQTSLAVARKDVDALVLELQAIVAAEAQMMALQPAVETQERLEQALDDARRAAAQLKTAEKNLRREETRLAGMQTRLAELDAGLAARVAAEADLNAGQAQLAVSTQQRDDLLQQITAQQADLKIAQDQEKQAARRLKDAEVTLSRQRADLAALDAQQIVLRRDLETLREVEARVEVLRAEIAEQAEAHNALSVQVATARSETARLHTQAEVLAQAATATCPVCESPLSAEHRATLLEQNGTRAIALEAELQDLQARQKTLASERAQKQKALRAAEKQLKGLPRLAEGQALDARIVAQGEVLETLVVAVDAARRELAAASSWQTSLALALAELNPQRERVQQACAQQQAQLTKLEKQLKALPRPAEAAQLKVQLAAQAQTLATAEAALSELAGAPDEVARIAAELESLGDPRRDYQRASDAAGRRAAVVKRQAQTHALVAELEEQCAAIETALQAYDELDVRMKTARVSLAEHQAGHQRYEQHVRESAALAERQANVGNLGGELQGVDACLTKQRAQREALAAEYDAAAYAALLARYGDLREALAEFKERLRLLSQQQRETQTEIATLQAVAESLGAAQAELDELAALKALLESLRQVLRDAGPEVTRRLVALISLHADRLYSDIMQGDSGNTLPARLRWTEDYDIVLTHANQERGFHQLSGGEQMSAGLAVRLALLRELSSIDVAFFDEPTANLDGERRANLAKQILNVKGFSQLFVISHDDTFEQDTDNVVRIEKVAGASTLWDG